MKPKRQCYFCVNNITYIDYKDPILLEKFMTPYAKILAGRRTVTCRTHQRKVANALKRARLMALAPFVYER